MERFAVPELTRGAIIQIAERVAAEVAQSVNEETPLLSAAMPHGERFQGVLSPAAPDGGAFSIRKQVISDLTLEDYLRFGALDDVRVSGPKLSADEDVSDLDRELAEKLQDQTAEGVADFLRFAIRNSVTMFISGGTSSGKTTFLNALLKEVPETERVFSIEDTRELKPPQPNYLALLASKGDQGKSRVTIQNLLEAALRLRPDRIFLGEIRGAEAYSFLQAVNTGHPGSLTTLHADSPRGAFERIALATMQAGPRSLEDGDHGLRPHRRPRRRAASPQTDAWGERNLFQQASRRLIADPMRRLRGIFKHLRGAAMKMRQMANVAGWALVAVLGLAAAALLWSADYAAAVYLISGQGNIWNGFTSGDLTLPALQAWTWWSLPVVHKLVTLSTAAVAVEAGIIGGGAYLLVAMPWKIAPPTDGARFATLKDLRAAGLLDGRPGFSMLLGTFRGHDVRYSGDSHFYINGPSRSGKGRGFIMPNLLEWRGSAITLDVKKENFEKTGAARLALGQDVFVFAPGSPESHCWIRSILCVHGRRARRT